MQSNPKRDRMKWICLGRMSGRIPVGATGPRYPNLFITKVKRTRCLNSCLPFFPGSGLELRTAGCWQCLQWSIQKTKCLTRYVRHFPSFSGHISIVTCLVLFMLPNLTNDPCPKSVFWKRLHEVREPWTWQSWPQKKKASWMEWRYTERSEGLQCDPQLKHWKLTVCWFCGFGVCPWNKRTQKHHLSRQWHEPSVAPKFEKNCFSKTVKVLSYSADSAASCQKFKNYWFINLVFAKLTISVEKKLHADVTTKNPLQNQCFRRREWERRGNEAVTVTSRWWIKFALFALAFL